MARWRLETRWNVPTKVLNRVLIGNQLESPLTLSVNPLYSMSIEREFLVPKGHRVFPEKLWAEILKDLRVANDPLVESIGDKLRTKREAFPEDDVSGHQEASMSVDYCDRVKPIREQTKPASDG